MKIHIQAFRVINRRLYRALHHFGGTYGEMVQWPSSGSGKKIAVVSNAAFFAKCCEVFDIRDRYRYLHAKPYSHGSVPNDPLWKQSRWSSLEEDTSSVCIYWIDLMKMFRPPVTNAMKMNTESFHDSVMGYAELGKWLENEYNELEALGLL